MALQDNYESGDFEYEEKLDWEKTKKLAKIRTNLCVILQVGGLLVPTSSASALCRHMQSVSWVLCCCERIASLHVPDTAVPPCRACPAACPGACCWCSSMTSWRSRRASQCPPPPWCVPSSNAHAQSAAGL